ncbi:MAG: 2-dehydropantoate 2-reductase [Firmicutes bacterium]|nr:2-dehydropantoate 2-reductase [Bacillota bacterium]
MHILVVGAGSLGQVFAAFLKESGVDVTLYGTPHTIQALREYGIRLGGLREQEWSAEQFKLIDDPQAIQNADLLLFATKGHQLETAATSLRHVSCQAVYGVQNGIRKGDILGTVFGAERLLAGATIVGAEREKGGRVLLTGKGRTYVGPLAASARQARNVGQAFVEALSVAGLPAVWLAEPAEALSVEWSKACNAIGSFGVSTLTRLPWTRIMQEENLVLTFLQLVRETAAVAQAEGIAVDDFEGFPIRTYVEKEDASIVQMLGELGKRAEANGGPPMRVSMLQDLEAGRPLEAEHVYGGVLDHARAAGITVPAITLAAHLIMGLSESLTS